jgi:ABC-type spermidine/putrescine transport system permease subunit II
MLFRIFIPVGIPGIIAATIFALTGGWGTFFYPMAGLYNSDQMVLTVGIVSDLIRFDVFQWGKIMAGLLLAAASPILIYAILMDYYIAGQPRPRKAIAPTHGPQNFVERSSSDPFRFRMRRYEFLEWSSRCIAF